ASCIRHIRSSLVIIPQLQRGSRKRGAVLSFGVDAIKRFLDGNNLDLVIRCHKVKDMKSNMMESLFSFSAPIRNVILMLMGNTGAFIPFTSPDLKQDTAKFYMVCPFFDFLHRSF
ncbi:Os01g0202601, partial [Oryza sativa Japonica Group]